MAFLLLGSSKTVKRPLAVMAGGFAFNKFILIVFLYNAIKKLPVAETLAITLNLKGVKPQF